jgi:hypothetical protein
MKALATVVALALAASAAAEEPRKGETAKPPALNLRLDDASRGAPRITFGAPPAAQTKDEREKGLPELGGKPSTDFDRPMSSGSSSGSVIPKPMDPSVPAR